MSRRSTAGSIQTLYAFLPKLAQLGPNKVVETSDLDTLTVPRSGFHKEIRVSSPTAQTPLRRELTGLESTLFGQMPPKASPLGQRKFTEPQRKRLREVFDLLDTDGSDELDYTELKDALQKFGVKLSLKELKNIWVSADKDANSGINFEDFCDSIEKLPTTLLDRRESMIKLQEVLTGANEDEDGKKGKGKQTPSSCSLM